MNEASKRYEALAEGIDDMRETMGAMVKGLVADGFNEEQARWAVVGIMTHHLAPKTEED